MASKEVEGIRVTAHSSGNNSLGSNYNLFYSNTVGRLVAGAIKE